MVMVIMDKTLKKKEREYSDVESFFFSINFISFIWRMIGKRIKITLT